MRRPSTQTAHVPIRRLCVRRHGQPTHPIVCKANLHEIQFLSHHTGELIPIPWQEFLDLVGEAHGMSGDKFLAFLLQQRGGAKTAPKEAPESPSRPGGPDVPPLPR